MLDLKLEMTLCELTRGTRRKIRVLGLVVAIRRNGSLEIRAPLKRWRKRLTLEYYIRKWVLRKIDQLHKNGNLCFTLIYSYVICVLFSHPSTRYHKILSGFFPN
uniref:hypothetical protein n=1 Tax=Jatropha curcas TaxID=180498 RepID=UPI00279CD334|nr:hypothetical protein QLP06_mgp074 [Jatropha curcas]WFG81165.1 hypothetical protein [Jatropha curcas]